VVNLAVCLPSRLMMSAPGGFAGLRLSAAGKQEATLALLKGGMTLVTPKNMSG
jgi:hypothetical protein